MGFMDLNSIKKFIFTVIFLYFVCVGYVESKVVSVARQEQDRWLRYLLPLPHDISIARKNILSPKDISIKLGINAGEIEKNAASELEQLFKAKAGLVPSGKKFEIIIGVLDRKGELNGISVAGADKLQKLPNNDQAYIIQANREGNKLLLTALDEKGVYYAVRTLYQLLDPGITNNEVAVPLACVLDWPDFNERGLWNGGCCELTEWLAGMKLNFGLLGNTIGKFIRGQKASYQVLDLGLIKKGRLQAFKAMPNITHYNFLHHYKLFDVYPELRGKGKDADAGSYFAHGKGKYSHPVPCASNPLLTKILSELMEDMASRGIKEVGCWLTERPAQCGCGKCRQEGQFPLEARATIKAWEIVKRKYPEFTIRLFISTTTNQQYYKILANLPKGVKIERACAAEQGRVRNLPRDLFRSPLFDYYAKSSVWMASYDVPITVNGAVETPEFKLPESSAVRIKDFVSQLHERGYSAAYGMLAWKQHNRRICGFNISALAEWSWNVNGRTTKQFAEAWATLNGCKQPEKFAEWSETMGPIEFDVYDSDMPECYTRNKAADMVKKCACPELGRGMFRYYLSSKAFDEKLEKARKALETAKGFEDKYYALETEIVISYIKMARAIYRIALAGFHRQDTAEFLLELRDAAAENEKAIQTWRRSIADDRWHPRVNAAINASGNTYQEIKKITDKGIKK
ncbi:MAG: glycoside hydrolase family 20 zincin-like fold domain-containing protein [Victivallaceae bacterium]|nr:glycoside hydrolase family 20 zincin-like fold domain-containing protein [Victivallaceae bacterium]